MPAQNPMGPVIATRTMMWQNAAGVNIPAVVEIGLPFVDPAVPDTWYCQLKTTGLGVDQLLTFEDVDSVGALCSALHLAGVFVATSPMAAGLDWSILPNWGFPIMPVPAANGGGAGGGNVGIQP